MGALLDIGEVRARTGLPAPTLHHDEQLGLIRSAGRNGLRRQYGEDTVDRVAAIVLCQRSGFRLHEIAELLATGGEPGWRDLVRAKLADVRARLRDLQEVERGLQHAVDCPCPDQLRCDHFRSERRAAVPVDAGRRRRLGPGAVARG